MGDRFCCNVHHIRPSARSQSGAGVGTFPPLSAGVVRPADSGGQPRTGSPLQPTARAAILSRGGGEAAKGVWARLPPAPPDAHFQTRQYPFPFLLPYNLFPLAPAISTPTMPATPSFLFLPPPLCCSRSVVIGHCPVRCPLRSRRIVWTFRCVDAWSPRRLPGYSAELLSGRRRGRVRTVPGKWLEIAFGQTHAGGAVVGWEGVWSLGFGGVGRGFQCGYSSKLKSTSSFTQRRYFQSYRNACR